MKVGSLFAGIGGFDIAAEYAGMEVSWQSEMDEHSSKVLDYYWPNKNLGDIHGVIEAPRVDILAGGFPCQSYSVAGNRGGLAEDRGALWWEFHRLIREGKPSWVVGENVPGLLSSNGGRDFTTIVRSLVQLGYGVVWGVLDAQYFGVAQRRRRLFIVGHSGGIPRPEILALEQGLSGNPKPSREEREGPTREADECPDSDSSTFRQLRSTEYVEDDIASTMAARDYKDATDLIAFTQNQREEVRDLNNLAGALAAKPGMKQQTYVMNGRQDPIYLEDTSLPIDTQRPQHPVITDLDIRRLTPLECERLQGFPDGWTDIGTSDSQRYKQLGNAVAVPVVSWILNNIAKAGGHEWV